MGGGTTLVADDAIDTKVTVIARKAPAQAVFAAIADAAGLAYRYDATARTITLSSRLPTPGRLVIQNSRPARIQVDGRDVGTTPIELAVPPGRHKITFVLASEKYTFTVNVEPGRKVMLSKSL